MGIDARPVASAVIGRIRRATTADHSEVAAMERACYPDPWPASAFASLPDNPRVFFAILRDERNRLAGYAIAWHVMDEGELANLAVAPDARRKGIASALLNAVLDDAHERGTTRIFLEVRESNSAARALYSARGFDEVGRRKGYYRLPVEDALILRRTLTP
jgi:ribosomal-protein-alanine N-acetyltransferase